MKIANKYKFSYKEKNIKFFTQMKRRYGQYVVQIGTVWSKWFLASIKRLVYVLRNAILTNEWKVTLQFK